jgi:uncharacterized membrane protein YesL
VIAGARVVWRAVRRLNHQSHLYVWGNLLWVVLSLPLVTAPAAWMALVRLGYLIPRQPGVTMDDFWETFRANWRRGIPLAILNVVIVVVNVSNLLTYWYAPGVLASFLRASWVIVLVVWFALQLYAFPLFFAMEQPTLIGAFRNAAVMILQNPLFTLVIAAAALICIALGVLLPPVLLLLVGGAVAVLTNTAVQDRLWAAGIQQPPPEPDEASEQSFYADF